MLTLSRLRALAGSGAEPAAALQTHPAPFALGEAAPDAEALVVREGELQALGADRATGAHALRLAGRATLLREERLGVRLGAQRVEPPRLGRGLGLLPCRRAAPGRLLVPGRVLVPVGGAEGLYRDRGGVRLGEQGQGGRGERHGKLLGCLRGRSGVTDRYRSVACRDVTETWRDPALARTRGPRAARSALCVVQRVVSSSRSPRTP